jgi:hypothetical protein
MLWRASTIVLIALGLAVAAVTVAPAVAAGPSKKQVDVNTRDFLKPVRRCAQLARAFSGVVDSAIKAEAVEVAAAHADEVLGACKGDRDEALRVPVAGLTGARTLGLHVFTVAFRGIIGFSAGFEAGAPGAIKKSAADLKTVWPAYQRAWAALNAARKRVGLRPLLLSV